MMSTFKGGENLKNPLHILWSVREKRLTIHKISQILMLSNKQVVRKLKQWDSEGWITYTPGKGRGNISTIDWRRNLEEHLIQELGSAFTLQKFHALNELDLKCFSESFHQKTVELLINRLSLIQQEKYPTLNIPIYGKRPILHPHKFHDTESGWILSCLYSRIVIKNELNEFEGDIVHHWKNIDHKFIFYIRPRVYWHDGEIVTVDEVIQSIQSTFLLPRYFLFAEKVVNISIESSRSFSIEYRGEEAELLLLLSQIDFSIYHPLKENIGTGAYRVEMTKESLLQLNFHPKYHLAQAFIDQIQFITIPSTLQRKMEWSIQQKNHQLQVYNEFSGIVSAYLNPLSKVLQKVGIREYIISFLKNFSILVGQTDSLKVPFMKEYPLLDKPEQINHLKIGYIVNQTKFIEALNNCCKKHNLDVEIIKYNIDQENHVMSIFERVDVLIMGEFPTRMELFPTLKYDPHHPFSLILDPNEEEKWFCRLYESFRKISYPYGFIRSRTSIYGYPDLSRSWIC